MSSINVGFSFDLKCTEHKGKIYEADINKFCKVEQLNVTSTNQEITSLNGKTESSNSEGLWIFTQTVHYLPEGISKFLPHIKSLVVNYSKLKQIRSGDLKQFPNLIELYLSHNQLKSLDGGLFEFNRKLQFISFYNNKLETVGGDLLKDMTNLKEINFGSNPCISEAIIATNNVPQLIQKLQAQCGVEKIKNI